MEVADLNMRAPYFYPTICPHHDGSHVKRGRGKHHFLPGRNGIYCNKAWLDDLLKVGNFVLQEAVVIHQPVPIILNSDEVLEAQGEPAPGMGLEFRQVDEKVTFCNRLWHKDLIPEPLLSF